MRGHRVSAGGDGLRGAKVVKPKRADCVLQEFAELTKQEATHA
jgi:hypothetical protein